MKFFDRIFRKKVKREIPQMPSWETIVDMMYDQNLDAFADEVVEVIYSKDRSMRYVILHDERGFFTYQLEAIYQYDDEEWGYICSDSALPASWEPFNGNIGISIFASRDEMKEEMKEEVEYKTYFL